MRTEYLSNRELLIVIVVFIISGLILAAMALIIDPRKKTPSNESQERNDLILLRFYTLDTNKEGQYQSLGGV